MPTILVSNNASQECDRLRHNALFQRFISALTRGGPGGMPRPIEVHTHDPLCYVGDMLAWLHQALASERELATALYSSNANASGDSTSQRFTANSWKLASKSDRYKDQEKEDGKVDANMTFVLDHIFEGVCRPFKVRVEQVLQSQSGLILSYKLSNLLEFYYHTIPKLLGQSAALSVTVKDAKEANRTIERKKTRSNLASSKRNLPLDKMQAEPLDEDGANSWIARTKRM